MKLANPDAPFRQIKFFLLITALLLANACYAENRLQEHSKGSWSLPGTESESRWLVIHGLAQSAQSGIYHIEVLSRAAGDPAWKVKHLVKHMAITESALLQSVVAPLGKGAVYPETFDDAYRQWQSKNDGAGGTVCQTDVMQCMHTGTGM